MSKAPEAGVTPGSGLYRDLDLTRLSGWLGYVLQPLPLSSVKRFYTDLTCVVDDIYSRTAREYRWTKEGNRFDQLGACISEENSELPEAGQFQVTMFDADQLTVRHENLNSIWRFFVDVQYAFGLRCCFLLDEWEARLTYLAAANQPKGYIPQTTGFFKLPLEIRRMILELALPRWTFDTNMLCDHIDTLPWKLDPEDPRHELYLGGFIHNLHFPCGLGDLGGYYFPFPKKLCRAGYGVLQASRQLRDEALPLAFRRTTGVAETMDDLFKLLVSLGRIGRANVECLEFGWLAKDAEPFPPVSWATRIMSRMRRTRQFALECMALLGQCKRLKEVRIRFEVEIAEYMAYDEFELDPGIRALRSLWATKPVGWITLQDHRGRLMGPCTLKRWFGEAMGIEISGVVDTCVDDYDDGDGDGDGDCDSGSCDEGSCDEGSCDEGKRRR